MPNMQTGNTAAQTAAAQANNAVAVNAQIRRAILDASVENKQNIYTNTIAGTVNANNNTLRIPFQQVGLVKGFIVKITGTLTGIAAGDVAHIARTQWNLANVLQNCTLYDLDNYQRINTTGWHLNMIGSLKEGFPHGAAVLLSAMDTPIKYGNNFNAVQLTDPGNATAGSFTMYYYVPCAYSASDLRGAIFAGVVNATAYLQLTLNPNVYVPSTSDPTLAIYTDNGTALGTPPTLTNPSVTVYQVYLDQLPRFQSGPQAGAPILPPLDIATQYRLNQTSLTGVNVGQDFPIPFSNFQQFLSLGIIYDQNGTLNGGTDINTLGLAAANTYTPFKVDPITQAWITRHKLMTDLPKGSYAFDFRNQPISTNQTGNMQLLLNASAAAAGTQVMAGFESFALINTVLGAASLPAS